MKKLSVVVMWGLNWQPTASISVMLPTRLCQPSILHIYCIFVSYFAYLLHIVHIFCIFFAYVLYICICFLCMFCIYHFSAFIG